MDQVTWSRPPDRRKRKNGSGTQSSEALDAKKARLKDSTVIANLGLEFTWHHMGLGDHDGRTMQ